MHQLVGSQTTSNTLAKACLLLAAVAAFACSPESELSAASPGTTHQEIRSTNKVLILGSSVSGGLASREAQAVATYAYGAQIDVVTPQQWKAMTVQEFMTYRAIIIGDAACESGTAAFQAAIDNRKNWGSVIDGDVAILATDPTSNGTELLVENAIRYVLNSEQKRTGMYIALGCAYQDAPAGTEVTLLEPFGTFRIQGVPGCADSGHMFEMYNDFMSRDMSDWVLPGMGGCAARSVFTTFPNHTFSYAAVATSSTGEMPIPGQQPYMDFTVDPGFETPYVGTPYIVVRGAMTLGAGCGIPATFSGEECDLGDGLNGQPALAGQQPHETCSWSCRSNWCGDGVVDADFGEECDNGQSNGRATDSSAQMGECTAFCKWSTKPPPTNLPPVARCQDRTVVAEYTCGGSANIDDGSYDPESQLAHCTQSSAGPFPLGETSVTLTCADQAGQASSCTAIVTVLDTLPPTVALNGAASEALECSLGGTYDDPGASASDLCGGSSISKSGAVDLAVPGSYVVSYVATDASGNASAPVTRTVAVADTLAPTLSLNGSASEALECIQGGTYGDPGATASDACAGDLTGAIVKAGSVNVAAPGSYSLSYSVADASGHATTASRSVTVRDTLVPQLQVRPGTSTVQCNGAPYVDPGATASDSCAGDLSGRIVTTSNLDQTRAGQYTVSYRVTDNAGNTATAARQLTVAGPCTSCIDVKLSDYNLFVLEDYTNGPDVQGKVAAGGNIFMQNFSVGGNLPASDISNVLVAGRNLTLANGSIWGNAFYGGTYSANQGVTSRRGTVARGTPIDFNARFAELRAMSAQLGALAANGTTTRESWGGIFLRGTNPTTNVFNVNASAFTGAALLSINVPSGSLVVINIRGASATFQNFGYSLTGANANTILYNFVDATTLNATSFGFQGTILAPYARMTFNNGSWDGGLYAVSLNGTAEGHLKPLNDRSVCP
ncbi:choice-of-anchor A family protein [Hyalangium gracile]|uniref:choice-of-anchor A family protein n=1 Tax=Hyalangium gracile TaxID=394092 RepID=UPI001CCD9EE3|nr:choice-of-anchor A family protein [Hyalangium gracile]